MKKSILTLVLGVLLQQSYAQDKPELPTCIILSGGLNLSSLAYNDYFFLTDPRAGFSAGAMLRTDGDVYAMAGLQYVLATTKMTNISNSESEDVSLQFVQLPVMFGMHLVKSSDSKKTFRVQMGASFSSLLSVSENTLGVTKDAINNTLLTFRAGLGADLGQFVFDFNYNLLVSHLYDVAGYDNKALLKCWEFMVGYKINLSKKESD